MAEIISRPKIPYRSREVYYDGILVVECTQQAVGEIIMQLFSDEIANMTKKKNMT
jgi:hypothetical protein